MRHGLPQPPVETGAARLSGSNLPECVLQSLFFVDTTFIRSWRRPPLQGRGSRLGRDRLRSRLVRLRWLRIASSRRRDLRGLGRWAGASRIARGHRGSAPLTEIWILRFASCNKHSTGDGLTARSPCAARKGQIRGAAELNDDVDQCLGRFWIRAIPTTFALIFIGFVRSQSSCRTRATKPPSKNKALQEQRTSRFNSPPTDPRQSSNAARPRASVSVRIDSPARWT